MDGPLQLGRYVLYDEIASGGMAKIHLGRASGALGFSKIVAIKRILPHLLAEQDFVDMFVDETRVAARIQHPNVVSTLDVAMTEGEVFLVMEFVLGESFARLLRACRKAKERVPLEITVSVIGGLLRGLHAAHEARNDLGELLGVVHRDVSPQNLLVGVDGLSRVIDFGVAKAFGRLQTTRDGKIKGKMSYMAPEQLTGVEPDRRTDVYAAGVVLWEALAGRRLHAGDNDAIVYANVLHGQVPPPSALWAHVPPALDAVVLRALARDARQRFATAEEMVLALESVVPPASPNVVGAWVRRVAAEAVSKKATRIAEIERGQYAAPSSNRLVAQESGSYPSSDAAPRSVRSGGELSGGYGRSAMQDAPIAAKDPWPLRVLVGVLGLLAVAGIVLTVVAMSGRRHEGDKLTVSVASSPSVSASATASEATPEPVVASPPPPSAPAAASAVPAPPATGGGARSSADSSAPPASAPKPPPASTATRSCNPPWTIDAKGIKRFRPECM